MDELTVREVCELLAAASSTALPGLLGRFGSDTRGGVVQAVRSAQRRADACQREMERLHALALTEQSLIDAGMLYVAGVDEVGRGALAGPVTAGACVFARDTHIEGVRDSKTLSARARESLAVEITSRAVAVSLAHVPADVIDRIGIQAATHRAMREAIGGLGISVDHILVDGGAVSFERPSTAIVRGDGSVRAIAAASIVAKVARDALLVALDAEFPDYGLAANKGYGSAEHMETLRRIGPSPVHRLSFAPCSEQSLF